MTDAPIPRFLSTEESFRIAKAFQDEAAANGIPAAVCGGLAMQLYGSDRNTKDIDFIAAAPLAREAKGKLTFGGSKYEQKGTPVDWIVRDDDQKGLYEAALYHRKLVHGLYSVAPNYLALIKLLAGRAKDEYDLAFLLRSGKVNRSKVHSIARELFDKGAFAIIDQFDSECLNADLMKAQDERRDNPKVVFSKKRLVIHTVKRPRRR